MQCLLKFLSLCDAYDACSQGRPKHMTAFFCVKLFEICTTGMAMLSYFSSTQELRRWIAAQVDFIVAVVESIVGN